jgi:outer membrane protein TolC
MVDEARAALEFARKDRGPDYAVGASYIHRGSLPPMATLGVGIVLPLYKGRKQDRAVAEAEASLTSQSRAAEAMSLRARATVERALLDLRAAVLEARAYSEGVLKVNALAVESALASFQAGKSPFVAVLEAHNTLYRDRWEHAELLFHVLWHSASLDAMGVVME